MTAYQFDTCQGPGKVHKHTPQSVNIAMLTRPHGARSVLFTASTLHSLGFKVYWLSKVYLHPE